MSATIRWFEIEEVDPRTPVSWDDISSDYKNMPIVPQKTYGAVSYKRYVSLNNPGHVISHDKEQPVVMSGAWYYIVDKYKERCGAYVDLPRAVLSRYWGRKKVTILSLEDYRNELDKFFRLADGVEKRSGYRAIWRFGHWGEMRRESGCVWIFGKPYWISKEQLSVVKSILRHIKRLDILTGEAQWLRLVQQAI